MKMKYEIVVDYMSSIVDTIEAKNEKEAKEIIEDRLSSGYYDNDGESGEYNIDIQTEEEIK